MFMNKFFLCFILLLMPLAALAADNAAVVARVNGAAITSFDLETEVDKLIPSSSFHGGISEETRSEYKEQALEELIKQELQYQDAQQKGIKPGRQLVKQRMKVIRDRFSSSKEYTTALGRAGLTEAMLRERVEKGVVIQEAIDKLVMAPSRMDDAALEDYFNKNKSRFKQLESVRLSMISAKDEKKATEALRRVQAGEDFGNIASRMSEDNYRIKGGDIGTIHRGRIYSELEDVAFKMKNGEVSGLIRAEGTWFILKVTDIQTEHQMTFEEAKLKLKKELEAKRSAELLEKWNQELRAKAKIEILLDNEKTKDVHRNE